MKVRFLSILSFMLLAIMSCKNHEKPAIDDTSKELSKESNSLISDHVYFFAPDIDTSNCEPLAECDCCDKDYLILDKRNLLRIDYCLAEKSVLKGSYELRDSEIIISYDSLAYFTEADDDNQVKKEKNSDYYVIKTEKIGFEKDTFDVINCKKKTLYKSRIEKSYGSIIPTRDSMRLVIDELKREGFWNKMKLE